MSRDCDGASIGVAEYAVATGFGVPPVVPRTECTADVTGGTTTTAPATVSAPTVAATATFAPVPAARRWPYRVPQSGRGGIHRGQGAFRQLPEGQSGSDEAGDDTQAERALRRGTVTPRGFHPRCRLGLAMRDPGSERGGESGAACRAVPQRG